MKYIALPASVGQQRLSFYLAMEEYVARTLSEPDAFFLWQVRPSVIFGRNQSLESEVNVDYCRANGIEVYRRKSGGGCVYADEDNIMFSYVTREANVDLAFHTYINMVVLLLRRLGVEAVGTAHNDVLIGDRKVSGTACYHLPGASIVHATMLYDTNLEHMQHAITPSAEKLASKGIQSVRQRVTFLKDHISLSVAEFKAFVRQTLCEGERLLSDADVAQIRQLEQSYLDQEFIHLIS